MLTLAKERSGWPTARPRPRSMAMRLLQAQEWTPETLRGDLADTSPAGGYAAVAGQQEPAAATAARPVALEADSAWIDRPHDALIFDIAGDLAAGQARQLEPANPNARGRLFDLGRRPVSLSLGQRSAHCHHSHERAHDPFWRSRSTDWR